MLCERAALLFFLLGFQRLLGRFSLGGGLPCRCLILWRLRIIIIIVVIPVAMFGEEFNIKFYLACEYFICTHPTVGI